MNAQSVVIEATGEQVGKLAFTNGKVSAEGVAVSIVEARRRRGVSDADIWAELNGWSNGYLVFGEGEAASKPVAAHLKGQHNQDSHGNDHAVPDVVGALDKLKLAGRIQLGEGEKLLSSRKFKSSDSNSWDLLAADVDAPNGREVRLGVVKPDSSKRWSAGANSKRDERVREIDAELERLEATDADQSLIDDLADERDELTGEADELGLNRTATVTPEGIGRLRSELAAGTERAQAHQKAYQAFWRTPDGRRLDELITLRDSDRDSRGAITPEAEASFDAQHGEEFRRLWALVPDSEAVFAEGAIPSPDAHDLVYSVASWDNGEGAWDVTIGVRPTDPEELDGWFPGTNDDAARFDPKDVKRLLADLGELAGGPVTAARRRRTT